MLWLVIAIALAGVVAGSSFRAPMLFVGSALIVACGLLTWMPWQNWLTGVAIFQAAYLTSLLISTAWSRRRGRG